MEAAPAKRIIQRRSGWVVKARGSDGRVIWKVVYFDVDGRRRKETTDAATKQLARRILADRQNAVERARLQKLGSVRELIAPAPAVTVRTFAKDYMEHVDAHLATTTARTYRLTLEAHIVPKLGALALKEINAGIMQQYSDARLTEGAAPATVRQDLAILSGMFREAMMRELVDRNPARLVKKPRVDNEIVRYLDADEEAALLSRAAEPLHFAILVAIHSGLRESEQTGLTWADVRWPIDTERPETGHVVVRRTKSHRDRVVPMSATLYRTLLKLKARNAKSPYVFASDSEENGGRYVRFNNTPWRAALRAAGVERFRWHDLRHTFGSRLAQAGVPITTIKELMGHSSVTVTMRYAHLAPSNLRTAVRALDAAPKVESATHGATRQPETLSATAGEKNATRYTASTCPRSSTG